MGALTRGNFGRKIEVGDKGWYENMGPLSYNVIIIKTDPENIYFEVEDGYSYYVTSLPRFLFRHFHKHEADEIT
ncbi:MAG: hypothetical protein GY827_04525 [Cytophagales bacterium]|nr:hypothetical protein [Cytophagales bacterium]